MRQRSEVLAVSTRRGLTDITPAVRSAVRDAGVRDGLCTLFVRHCHVWEHRTGSHRRQVVIHVLGE